MKKYLKLLSPKTARFFLDRMFLALAPSGHSDGGDKNKRKKICLLRLDGLGDVVLFADALRGYREFFDGGSHEITLVTEHWIAPLFEGCPYMDKVAGLDTRSFKKSLVYRSGFLGWMKAEGFDVFINSCLDREISYGDIMACASRAGSRYGFQTKGRNVIEKMIGDRFYTGLAPLPGHEMHELEKNAEMVSFVAKRPYRPRKPQMDWSGKAEQGDYFVIAPGTKGPAKKWPAERFAALCRLLYEDLKLKPVIAGGKGDASAADAVMRAAPELRFDDRTGKLDLPSLARLISGARFFLGNDSGPSHLAAATGIKTFVITHGTSFIQYASYPEYLKAGYAAIHQDDASCFNCHGDCIYGMKNGIFPCIENISVEQARRIVLKNMEPGSNPLQKPK